MSNARFRKAMQQSSGKQKVSITGRHVPCQNGRTLFIDRWVFYTHDEILGDDGDIKFVVDGIENPSIQIPMPRLRRKMVLDGKFFMMKNASSGFELYCPYYYFFFEHEDVVQEFGWQNYVYDSLVSKLDRKIQWVNPNAKEITEDPVKKKAVLALYAEKFDLRKQLKKVEEAIYVQDPKGIAREEYEAVMERMMSSIGKIPTGGVL